MKKSTTNRKVDLHLGQWGAKIEISTRETHMQISLIDRIKTAESHAAITVLLDELRGYKKASNKTINKAHKVALVREFELLHA